MTLKDKIEDATGWTAVGVFHGGWITAVSSVPVYLTGKILNIPSAEYYVRALVRTGYLETMLGMAAITGLFSYELTRQYIRMKRGLNPVG